MATKKSSEKGFVKFIKDAAKKPELHEKMMAVVNKKGKGETPEKLQEKFQNEGYDLSLHDCELLLFILKEGMKNPSLMDWSY